MKKLIFGTLFPLSLIAWSQDDNGEERTKRFNPFSTNAFHVEIGLGLGLGRTSLSFETKYATDQNFEIGLELSTKKTFQVFNNNFDLYDNGSVVGILTSIRLRNMDKKVSPYCGLKAGILFVESGGRIVNKVVGPSTKTTEIGVEVNYGLYLGVFNFGFHYAASDNYLSKGINLGLRF